MVYSTTYGHPIHRDCNNFVNGICRLNGVPVDPNGPTCPRFTPKSTTKTIQLEAAYPGARRSYQMHPMMGQAQPLGRRDGRGIGMGTGTGMGRASGMTIRNLEKESLTQWLEELEKLLERVRGRLERLRRGKR